MGEKMGKYSIDTEFVNFSEKAHRAQLLCFIANELAERNRLNRLELKIQISIAHKGKPSIPTDELEDQA